MSKHLPLTSIILFGTLAILTAAADSHHIMMHRNGITDCIPTDSLDSLTVQHDTLVVHYTSGQADTLQLSLSPIQFTSHTEDTLFIYWTENSTSVFNPFRAQGVTVESDNGHVTVNNLSGRAINMRMGGSTQNGSLLLTGNHTANIVMDGLTLTNPSGGAITFMSDSTTSITLMHGNTLCDGMERDSALTDTQRGCITSAGTLNIQGEGQLNIAGNFKHAVYTAHNVALQSCTVVIDHADNDGIRAKQSLTAKDCDITISNIGGNGMNADDRSMTLENCRIGMHLTKSNTNGINCDSLLLVTGCNIDMQMTGDRCKGLKAGKAIQLSGTCMTGHATGNTIVKKGSPSYCTFVKSGCDLAIKGTKIDITHTGKGGRGLSASNSLTFTESLLTARFACDGDTYVNADNQTDYYTSRILDSDGNMQLQSGQIDIMQTGLGGKGIVCGEKLETGMFEAASDRALHITVETTGTAIVNDTISDERFGCPKAIKSKGNLYIYSGTIHAITHGMGGEGIECCKGMKVEGGELICETFDDGINVANNLKINGGRIFAFSSDNDGIDTNGDISINGGIVVAMNAHFLDEDFDCDRGSSFAINGGTILGVARSSSMPTRLKQPYIQYIPAMWDTEHIQNFHQDDIIAVTTSDRQPIISARIPQDIQCAFVTASSELMKEDAPVHIFRMTEWPTNAEPILDGRVSIGGDAIKAEPAITLPATMNTLN